jgi:transducin (beta)-like 1
VWNVGDPPKDGSAPDLKPLKLAYFAKADHGDLTSLDWNFDGSLLAIGSYDSILRICTASGKLYFSNRQHEGPIFAAKFSKSGQWLLTGSLDGSACVWNVKTKKLHMQYRWHTDCCLDLDWLDDTTFASCGADMVIFIIKIHDKKPIKTLSGHTNEINQIKCNSSRTRLASCSDDQTARIWDVSDLSGSRSPDSESIPGLSESDRVIQLEGHEHSVSSIAWCPPSVAGGVELIATASFDSTARLWDSLTGECLKVFSDHKRPVYALAFSPDGRWLSTGSGDGWFHIYSVKTKKKKWSWYAGQDKPGVFEISWQQSGNLDRISLALERNQVGIIDVPRITAMKDDS